jgi:hypothetical protein
MHQKTEAFVMHSWGQHLEVAIKLWVTCKVLCMMLKLMHYTDHDSFLLSIMQEIALCNLQLATTILVSAILMIQMRHISLNP